MPIALNSLCSNLKINVKLMCRIDIYPDSQSKCAKSLYFKQVTSRFLMFWFAIYYFRVIRMESGLVTSFAKVNKNNSIL